VRHNYEALIDAWMALRSTGPASATAKGNP
jgi:hypothetical protein